MGRKKREFGAGRHTSERAAAERPGLGKQEGPGSSIKRRQESRISSCKASPRCLTCSLLGLLLFCASPRCSHVLRALPPEASLAFAESHDAACVTDLLGAGPLPGSDPLMPALFALGQHATLAEVQCHLRPDELLSRSSGQSRSAMAAAAALQHRQRVRPRSPVGGRSESHSRAQVEALLERELGDLEGPLFTAFRLEDLMGLPASVMPHKPGGGGVKLAHNGHANVGPRNISQCLQHGLAADVIENTNPVHRQDGGIRAGLRRNQPSMGDGFGAGAGGEGKLKRLARIQEPICKVLRQGASNQTPQEAPSPIPLTRPFGF